MSDEHPSAPSGGPSRAPREQHAQHAPGDVHEAIRRRAGLGRRLDSAGRERRRPFGEAPRLAGSGFASPPRAVLLVVGLVCLAGLGAFVALRYQEAARRVEESQAAERRAALQTLLPSDPAKRAAQALERQQRIRNLFQGALRDSENGQVLRETEGYRTLLDQLHEWPQDDLAARSLGEIPWQSALDEPDRLRGEVLDYTGLVAELTSIKLELPFFGGADVWRGMLFKADGSDPVFVDLLEAPPVLELERDVVVLSGVFYRTVSYTGRDDQPRVVPWLVAKRLDHFAEPRSGLAAWLARHSLPIMVALSLAALVVGLLLSSSAGRPRKRPTAAAGLGIREHFERRTASGETVEPGAGDASRAAEPPKPPEPPTQAGGR
jgi:hypothetical protein